MAIGIALRPGSGVHGGPRAHRRVAHAAGRGLTVGAGTWRVAAPTRPAWMRPDVVASLLLAVLLVASYPLSAQAVASLVTLFAPAGDVPAREFGRAWVLAVLAVSPHLAGVTLAVRVLHAGLPRTWFVLACVAISANAVIALLLLDVFRTIGG